MADRPLVRTSDEARREFVLENFRALREEIVARVGHHQRLMWWKVAACAAFVAFLLTSLPDESLRGLGFAVVPAAAIVFDFLVGKNIRAIHCLGIFIRDHIERDFYGIEMWETVSGQAAADSGVRNYGPTDAAVLGSVTLGVIALSSYMMFTEWAWQLAGGLTLLWLGVFGVSFYKVEETPDGTYFHLRRDGERKLGLRLSNEATIASAFAISQQVTSEPLTPLGIYFKHAAPETNEFHEAHFGCPVHFETDRDAILVGPAALVVPNRLGDASIAKFFDTHLEAELEKFADDSSLLEGIADGSCAVGIADSNDAVVAEGVSIHWFDDPAATLVDITAAGVSRHASDPAKADSLLQWLATTTPNALFAIQDLEVPANGTAPAGNLVSGHVSFLTEPDVLSDLGFLIEEADRLVERARYP